MIRRSINLSYTKLQSINQIFQRENDFPTTLSAKFTTLDKWNNNNKNRNVISRHNAATEQLKLERKTSSIKNVENDDKSLNSRSINSGMMSESFSLNDIHNEIVSISSKTTEILNKIKLEEELELQIENSIEDENDDNNNQSKKEISFMATVKRICSLCRIKFPKEATFPVLSKHVNHIR